MEVACPCGRAGGPLDGSGPGLYRPQGVLCPEGGKRCPGPKSKECGTPCRFWRAAACRRSGLDQSGARAPHSKSAGNLQSGEFGVRRPVAALVWIKAVPGHRTPKREIAREFPGISALRPCGSVLRHNGSPGSPFPPRGPQGIFLENPLGWSPGSPRDFRRKSRGVMARPCRSAFRRDFFSEEDSPGNTPRSRRPVGVPPGAISSAGYCPPKPPGRGSGSCFSSRSPWDFP